MATRLSWRPFATSKLFFPSCASYSRPAMTEARPQGPKQPRNQRPEIRPPLTHFLCLPLVNSTSLPQLESSVTAFKTAHPPVPVAELPNGRAQPAAHEQDASRPLIPEGAIRPLGTLHLTLGVMSLPTPERLDQALSFFHSLDLAALMREAERVAIQSRRRRNAQDPSAEIARNPGEKQPLSISLESLHALPRAKAATVLHASPVDSTGRLYPFCVMLRDKFLEAGFLQGEFKGKNTDDNNSAQAHEHSAPVSVAQNVPQSAQGTSGCNELKDDDKLLLDELPSAIAEESVIQRERIHDPLSVPTSGPTKVLGPYEAALSRKPKPRPLLLHATLVNTIYVKGRPRSQPVGAANGRKGRSRPERLEFDARGLMAQYRDYYSDETRTTPRARVASTPTPQSVEQKLSTGAAGEDSASSSSSSSSVAEGEIGHKRKNPSAASQPRYPFVWAKEIPIDSVCICEMGAKKLEENAENPGWNARLGEKYTIVAQRGLGPGECSPSSVARSESEDSVDGGVRLK